MKRALAISATFLIAISMISCVTRKISEEKFNVVRVFMHEQNHYSFYIDNGSSELVYKRFSSMNTRDVRIFKDVPNNESMWVKVEKFKVDGVETKYSLEIHIRSEKDIEGGGWDHGKFGSGQTNVIQ